MTVENRKYNCWSGVYQLPSGNVAPPRADDALKPSPVLAEVSVRPGLNSGGITAENFENDGSPGGTTSGGDEDLLQVFPRLKMEVLPPAGEHFAALI